MIRINLLKAEAKPPVIEVAKKEKKAVSPSLIIGLVIIAAAAVGFYLTTAISKEKNLLDASREEKNKLGDIESKLDKVNAQKNIVMKKISLIQNLKSFQEVAVKIMDELSKNIPEWVWLTEVTYDKKIVRIKGRAASNKLVADYISNLEASPNFENVELVSSIQQTIANERFQEFSLNTTYVPPAPANPPPNKEAEKEKK